MDHLREGIGLRAVGQRDPLVEYQREAYDAFRVLMARVKEEAVGYFFSLVAQTDAAPPREDGDRTRDQRLRLSSASSPQVAPSVAAAAAPGGAAASAAAAARQTTQGTVVKGEKVGRNAPCPCGSGRKYKNCHGG
jgi:preprotein translocase subunit SecA